YYVTSGGIYNFDSYLPGHYDDESDSFDWVDYNAHFSFDYFSDVNGPNGQDGNDYDYAASLLLSRAQRTSAGFVIMFLSSVNTPPIANAGGDKGAGQRELILFDGSLSSDDISIVNYTWDFGDGTYGYGVEVAHDYSEPGSYNARLTVRDSFGEESTDFFEVVIVDTEPPIAFAGEDVYVSEGEAVHLNSSGSSDNVGIAEYYWLLEGSVIGNGLTLDYSFDMFGTYIITLRVQDDARNFDTDTVVVVVVDVIPPHSDAGSNLTLEVGQNWRFDASNSTDNNAIVSYIWNFGDGSVGTEMVVNHSYEGEGTYIVTLLVQDVSGNLDKSRVVVLVRERSAVDISGQNDLPLFLLLAFVAVVIAVVAVMMMKRRSPESKS
ncbi:MAG: PKD domain-containing protein, partial [Thermoplasmata archaeon]